MSRRTQVFGPAYLDRVIHVDRPLIDPADGPPLDQSVDGVWRFGADGLTVVDPEGHALVVAAPEGWPGPWGEAVLSRPLLGGGRRKVRGRSWHDDLGGMGAGYASALGGDLVSALGAEDDPTSQGVADRLRRAGIAHRPVRVADHPADWTLLMTSGVHGDKLPIGFRGCQAALGSWPADLEWASDLRVVAGVPNRLAAEALRAPGARVRFFAPAMRNMLDRACPVSDFAGAIDLLSCNDREWRSLDDREEVAWRVSVLVVTEGAAGATIRFTDHQGEARRFQVPAFPRSRPPRDTNRAGEAFGSTLAAALLDDGWRPGVLDEALARRAAQRASAAAALVLDRLDFGFPSSLEIDEALRRGRVDDPDVAHR